MLLNLARAQSAGVCDVQVAYFHNTHAPNVELAQRARLAGVPVREVRSEGQVSSRAVRTIASLLTDERIDILHTHGFKGDVYGRLAGRMTRRPIVATCHNWLSGGWRLGIYNWLDGRALRGFDRVVAVSAVVARRLHALGVRSDRVRQIANGIDVSEFDEVPPARPSPTVIGMVARLDWQKGFEELLLAARSLREDFPSLQFLVVGDGPDAPAIAARALALGVAEQIVFAGQRSDIVRVYSEMDVFVLPSRNEGLPMTVLEAMASRRPVVATAVGGVPSVIDNGVTGLLVAPADARGLELALRRILHDADLRARLATSGRERVEREYSATGVAQRYQQVYEELLRSEGWRTSRLAAK